DGTGDAIPAHAALAPDQDRRVGVGDTLDDPPDPPHRRASIKKRNVSVLPCQRPVRGDDLTGTHGRLPGHGSQRSEPALSRIAQTGPLPSDCSGKGSSAGNHAFDQVSTVTRDGEI